jgi:hypothetical protein
VVVLGLYDQGGSQPELQIFMDAFQITFPVLLSTGASYNAYRQSGATSPYPLDYVIDQNGRVAFFSTEYTPEEMTAVIDHLLANPSPIEDLPGAGRSLGLEARPNPFNPRTEIHFRMPGAGTVDLDIHDARGRLVRRLVAGKIFEDGPGMVVWDGTDDQGRSLPSGLFLARIRAAGFSAISKLTLLR